MVVDILDKNLEELLNVMKEKKFSLKTVLMIADQMVIKIKLLFFIKIHKIELIKKL